MDKTLRAAQGIRPSGVMLSRVHVVYSHWRLSRAWAALSVLSTPAGSYLVTPPQGESSDEEPTMEPVLQTVLWGQLAQLFTPPADDAKGGERA